MTGLRPGDVITDEPTTPGTVIRDGDGDIWTLTPGGWRWDRGRVTHAWADFRSHPYGQALTLVSIPDATGEPAEEWETVTAGQVSVGDHIEITRKWPEGRFVASGVATRIYCGIVELGDRHAYTLDDTSGLHTSSTIRRRTRKPMPEPEAPAVVRHAGCLFARRAANDSQYRWLRLDETIVKDPPRNEFVTWPWILALDPGTDPVPVDLNGGA